MIFITYSKDEIGIEARWMEGYEDLHDFAYPMDTILIGGAGLIPVEICKKFMIINSHPGYLPNVRGLDAFKWAILEGQPIGVTTHIIDGFIDLGMMIDRRIVGKESIDTFHSWAMRVYETEIDMLIEAIDYEGEMVNLHKIKGHYEPNKRMDAKHEMEMISKFK